MAALIDKYPDVPRKKDHPIFLEFIERYNAGLSIVALANQFNMSVPIVKSHLDFARVHGLFVRKGKAPRFKTKLIDEDPKQLGRLVRAWNAGVEVCDLVERFQLGDHAIRECLHDAELAGMYVRRSNQYFAALARPKSTFKGCRPKKVVT